jgi:hypothetical protein
MLLEDYMDRVSGRLLTEISTLEIAVDGRRPPYTETRSGIYIYIYIAQSLLVDRITTQSLSMCIFAHTQNSNFAAYRVS